mmetsp:Transcript_21679/g.32028  ORF Transcript_21679/g.32028 Transcript_21679/m.32028 type:complete len:111 (+) Transcript_21679:3405-3737(+)
MSRASISALRSSSSEADGDELEEEDVGCGVSPTGIVGCPVGGNVESSLAVGSPVGSAGMAVIGELVGKLESVAEGLFEGKVVVGDCVGSNDITGAKEGKGVIVGYGDTVG